MELIQGLYFVDRLLLGGIQKFVLENLKKMNLKQVQIDFLLLDDGNKYELEDEFRHMGCNVYKLDGIWFNNAIDYLKYRKALNQFFKQHHNYQFVHLHASSKNFGVLAIAKKYGIEVRIAHSHNIEFQTRSKAKKLIGNLFMGPLRYYATDYFACSYSAGKWLFGEKIAESSLQIVPNAVDTDRFYYHSKSCIEVKEKLKLRNKFVVGHVGRFTHQKNHTFLIDIFAEIAKKREDAVLLLIGTGELEDDIRAKVKTLGLTNKVIFEGFQTEVDFFMRAMDVMVFPSEYEGLGLVLVEAQASGLPCVASADVIPRESKVSSLLRFVKLSEQPDYWAEITLEMAETGKRDVLSDIRKAGYDIHETASFLQEFYISRCAAETSL